MVIGEYVADSVLLEDSDNARDLFARSQFGTMLKGGIVKLSLLEATFLSEKEALTVKQKNKTMSWTNLLAKGRRLDKSFPVKYSAFRDLRTRGYIVKTALKFGADFRVYDKGHKIGKDHAKWIVFAVHESEALRWQDFSAKNRVAHGTRKNLLLAVVDDEDEVTYWEVSWKKP